MKYTITVTAVDADRTAKFIDVYTAITNAHPDDIAKAMKNVYSDEHPGRVIIKIAIEIT